MIDLSEYPPVLTIQEVAAILRVKPQRVRNDRLAGKGPKAFKNGRDLLFLRSDLEQFIEGKRNG